MHAVAKIGFKWFSLLNWKSSDLSKWMHKDGILSKGNLESHNFVLSYSVSLSLYTIFPASPRSLSNQVLQIPPPYVCMFNYWNPALLSTLETGANLRHGESVWQPTILNKSTPSLHLFPRLNATMVA